MQSIFFQILLLVTSVLSSLSANEKAEPVERQEHQKLSFLVSTQDLYFDQENILINIDGFPHIVCSLEKTADQWIARVSPHGDCPWGHPLCAYCGLCHHRSCPLYQRRCAKSQ